MREAAYQVGKDKTTGHFFFFLNFKAFAYIYVNYRLSILTFTLNINVSIAEFTLIVDFLNPVPCGPYKWVAQPAL